MNYREGQSRRPLKFLLPPELVRRMEEALLRGDGGFMDRHELATAAIDEYLLELAYPDSSDLGTSESLGGGEVTTLKSEDSSGRPRAASCPVRQVQFALPRVRRGVASLDLLSSLRDEPLLGLHNRDWPSLWVLTQLASVAIDGPVPLRDFLADVTRRAWLLAEELTKSHLNSSEKLTALLPTNREKPQSAEDAFKAFAVASIARRPDPDSHYTVTGPLPAWRAIALTSDSAGEFRVGITDTGWDLADLVAGIGPETPHARDASERFLDFLKRNAPGDWWGFEMLFRSVQSQPTRKEYGEAFRSARQWKESVAISAAQGYLARGREWGLVRPKMSEGRYALTPHGQSMATLTFAS
jgi:hypothetical protein